MDDQHDCTPCKRRKQRRERRRRDPETQAGSAVYFAGMQRMISGYGKAAKRNGVTGDDLWQLDQLARLLEQEIAACVEEYRSLGFSWEDIGQATGMTTSGAYRRFKQRPKREDPQGALKRGQKKDDLR